MTPGGRGRVRGPGPADGGPGGAPAGAWVPRRWWATLEPVTEHMDAGGAHHRLRWVDGRLVLCDHDLAAERALAALGGEPCLCVEVAEAWRQAVGDPDTLWSMTGRTAGYARELTRLAGGRGRPPAVRVFAAGPGGFRHAAMSDWADRLRRAWRLELLASLSPALRNRVVLSAVVAALRRAPDPARAVAPATVDRAREALLRSVQAWGPRRRSFEVTAEVWVDARRAPAVAGLLETHRGAVAAAVGPGWLLSVWAPGLAVTEDCFVVEAGPVRGGRCRVRAVRWEHTGPWGWTPVTFDAVAVRRRDGWWLSG